MRAAVNTFGFIAVAFALYSGAASAPASAEGASQEGADLFVPSLHVISGVLVQDWDASASSEICRGCTFPDSNSQMLRSSVDGNDRDVTPYVGGGLEVMTPSLPIPGALRLFVGGEFSTAFGVERKVAREGDPGTVGNPAPAAAPSQAFDEDIATGQGSLTSATMDHFTYGAYAGIAVPLELFGRQLRLKPAFAWMRYGIDVEGEVSDAECFQPAFGLSRCNERVGGFLRPISMRAEGSETFDGIGPGLDLEMDTGRYGPVGSSIFLSARFYRIIGSRTVELDSQVSSFKDLAGSSDSSVTDETRARFSFEIDPWMYRAGIGFRLQWLGYDN